jgi:hypothetical protein
MLKSNRQKEHLLLEFTFPYLYCSFFLTAMRKFPLYLVLMGAGLGVASPAQSDPNPTPIMATE